MQSFHNNYQLSQETIIRAFTEVSGLKFNENLNLKEAQSILNVLNNQRGYEEFPQDVITQLCDRVVQFEKQNLTIFSLSQAFVAADQTLMLKMGYMSEQAEQARDSIQSIDEILQTLQITNFNSPYRGQNIIFIDEITFDLQDLNVIAQWLTPNPQFIIRLGRFFVESSSGQTNNVGQYTFLLQCKAPLENLWDDLIIEVFDRGTQQPYGIIMLSPESLPLDEIKQAPFNLILNGQTTQNQLIVSCQLMIGEKNICRAQFNDKKNGLAIKLLEIEEELQVYEIQLNEIRKPFQRYPSANQFGQNQDFLENYSSIPQTSIPNRNQEQVSAYEEFAQPYNFTPENQPKSLISHEIFSQNKSLPNMTESPIIPKIKKPKKDEWRSSEHLSSSNQSMRKIRNLAARSDIFAILTSVEFNINNYSFQKGSKHIELLPLEFYWCFGFPVLGSQSNGEEIINEKSINSNSTICNSRDIQ